MVCRGGSQVTCQSTGLLVKAWKSHTKDSHFIKKCKDLREVLSVGALIPISILFWENSWLGGGDLLSLGQQGMDPINKYNLFWFLVSGLRFHFGL